MKVLIAAPIGGTKQYSINTWFEWIARQTFKDYDVCICTNGNGYKELAEKVREVEINDVHDQHKKIITLELEDSEDLTVIQKITYSREKIRRYAVKNGYDYIFFLDTDTIPFHLDAIKRLVERMQSCISGVYFYKRSQVPVIIDKDTKTNISIDKLSLNAAQNKIIEVWGMGFGCLLLARSLFENLPFDYDLFKENYTDDFGYCELISRQNIKRWVDPIVICKHLVDPEEPAKTDVIPLTFVTTPKQLKEINDIQKYGETQNSTEGKVEDGTGKMDTDKR